MSKDSIIFILMGLLLTVSGFSKSVSKYELIVGQGEGPYLIRLEITPNGQIIDPGQSFYLGYYPEGITVHPTKPWILVSADSSMFTFQMNGDGTLYLKNSTILNSHYGYDAQIFNQWYTPNGELALIVVDDSTGNRVYSVDSNGNLTDTGNRWVGAFCAAMDPLGRIFITDFSADTPQGNNVYQIDYANKQLIKIQVLSWTTTNYWSGGGRGMLFSPDGKMAFYWGLLEYAYDQDDKLRVFDIDSTGNVSIAQRFNYPFNPNGGSITPNGNYFYLNTDGSDSTVLFQVDSTHSKLIDTGKRLSIPPVVEVYDYRISPDGRLMTIMYYDAITLEHTLTTAYVLGDGTLAWTGYTFPFQDIYGPIGRERVIIPIYTTDVPYELWKTLDDDK